MLVRPLPWSPSPNILCVADNIVVIGEEPEFPEIDTIERVQRELKIIGTCSDPRQNIEDVISMQTTKVLIPNRRNISIKKVNQTLDLMKTGEINGRVVITTT